MDKLVWSAALDTGIDVIDRQHRRLVDCINQLHDAHANGYQKEHIGKVIADLVDYTHSLSPLKRLCRKKRDILFARRTKKVTMHL